MRSRLRIVSKLIPIWGFIVGPAVCASPPSSLPTFKGEMNLDEIASRGLQYFLDEMSPRGLVRDRAPAFAPTPDQDPRYQLVSIATTGLALAVFATHAGDLCPEDLARDRCDRILTFLDTAPTSHGFFSHWWDFETSLPRPDSEVSSIDSCLILPGVLAAAVRFGGTLEVRAHRIADRMDWSSLLTPAGLSHGWRPDGTRIPWNWGPNEGVLTYLFALGNPGLDRDVASALHRSWRELRWEPFEVDGHRFIGESGAPLFCYQVPALLWPLDRIDDGTGRRYARNVLEATRAARAASLARPDLYPGGVWGINAGDVPGGSYRALAFTNPHHRDGTVNLLSGLLTSLPFLPVETREALRRLHRTHPRVFESRFGLAGSANFRSDPPWIAPDVIGLDLAQALIALRDKTFQDLLRRSPRIRRSLGILDGTLQTKN